MKIEKISVNGKIFSANVADINALDSGLTFGLVLFETFRASNKKVFLLQEHLARLYSSIDILGIKRPQKKLLITYLGQIINEFKPSQDLFLRLMVTGGNGELKLSNQKYGQPKVIIYAVKIPKFTPLEKSAKTLNSITRQPPEYFKLSKTRLKTNDYLSAHLAQTELDEFKQQNSLPANTHLEGILLSPSGYVAEALTSNIFWTKNGQLFTPPLSLGVLPGIMRQYLFESHGAREKLIKTKDLEAAEEVFLSNGVNFICSISKINNSQKAGIYGVAFTKIFKKLLKDIKNPYIIN